MTQCDSFTHFHRAPTLMGNCDVNGVVEFLIGDQRSAENILCNPIKSFSNFPQKTVSLFNSDDVDAFFLI